MLRVRLFGSGRLLDETAEIKLPSRLWTLPLLAYLLIHRSEMLPRRRVAFTLWPDDPEEAALTNLRRNLHRLVHALPSAPRGASWITMDGHTITWNASSEFTLDVSAFEGLRTAATSLEEAVAAYTGDLLVEFYEEWIAAERERLRQMYHADLGTLIVVHRSKRDFATAARYAQLLLGADPWHENALRQLMSVRYEAGDAAGALAAFDQFAIRLRADMRTDPMPETVMLRDAIARSAPIAGVLAVAEPALRRGPAPAPFVGRSEDVTTLRSRWARAASGAGGLVLVRGEAGIGKSRLVSEVALVVEAEGGRFVAGNTSSPERDPFESLAAVIRGAIQLVAGMTLHPQLFAAIAELVPELRTYRADIPPLTALDSKSERARLLDALVHVFGALARPRPLLVVLEDLHRAGSTTLEALADIVPRLERTPVFFVGTYRPEDAGPDHPLREFERSLRGKIERVSLQPLGEDHLRLLAEAIAPRESRSDPGFIASLVRRSQGNPLFATELLHDAQYYDGTTRLVPESVGAMIGQRISMLDAPTRATAEIAAVAGESFTVDLVRDVGGLPDGQLLDALDELLDRHIIRESLEQGQYEYAFTHHLIHAAIYDASPSAARTRRHRRVAHLLAAATTLEHGERAAEIALHFERGDDPAKAADQYARAARRAARLNANAEARTLLTRALSLSAWPNRERFDLLMLRARIDARLGDTAQEDADLSALDEVSRQLDDDAMSAVLERRVEMAFRRGDRSGEVEATKQLAQRATASSNARWLAVAATLRAKRTEREGDYAVALTSALEARELYRTMGDNVARARVTALAAQISTGIPGAIANSKSLADDALSLAEQAGDAEALLETLGRVSVVWLRQQDYRRYADLNESALKLCLELGDRAAEARRRSALGTAHWRLWHIDEALEQLGKALQIVESTGLRQHGAVVLSNLGGALADVGDFSGALEHYHRAVALGDTLHSVAATAAVWANIGDVAWQCGDLERMQAALRASDAFASKMPVSWLTAPLLQIKARVQRCRREFAASVASLEEAGELSSRVGRRAEPNSILDDLALTHLGSGNPQAALEAFERGAAAPDAGTNHDQVRHAWIDACIARGMKDRKRCRAALERGHATFLQLSASLSQPRLRVTYAAIRAHVAMIRALEHDVWPSPGSPCVVAFPDP